MDPLRLIGVSLQNSTKRVYFLSRFLVFSNCIVVIKEEFGSIMAEMDEILILLSINSPAYFPNKVFVKNYID